MELRSIQYFVQVADEGSITRTADKIGIAQPALTRHIRHLEAELGTQLLTRMARAACASRSGSKRKSIRSRRSAASSPPASA
jgi:LysR family transcriptional regulator, nitrogen assimilation regulatory protein